MKNSFVLYTDYRQHTALLSVEEKAQLLDAIFAYAAGEEVELTGMALMAFSFIKAQMDRDAEKYSAICEKRRIAGKMGGAPKGNSNASKQANASKNNQNQPKQANASKNNQSIAKQADTDTENDTDTVTDNDNVTDINSEAKPRSVFKPPTLEEVEAYCLERNNGIDAQQFIDFYSSKGWMIGKNKMKDWKAAVRTWEQRNNKPAPTPNQGFFKVDDDFFRRKMGL